MGKWWKVTAAATVVAIAVAGRKYGMDKVAAVRVVEDWSERLGVWAMPAYVAMHTATLCLCLPYAVLLEAAASLVFGFWRGVACVFAAKLSAASASFLVARVVLRRWTWAMEKARGNKYFGVVWRGVERDGWRFVLLARFSPVPSYVINYALAATEVRFLLDFLAPTAVGCLPMILQNASLGSLAGAASSSSFSSYVFPVLGILSSLLISWRIKTYSALSIPSNSD